MDKLIRFSVNHPTIIISIVLMVSLISVFGLLQLRPSTSTENLIPLNDPIVKKTLHYNKVFGNDRIVILSIRPANPKKSIYDKDFMALVYEINQILSNYFTLAQWQDVSERGLDELPNYENRRSFDLKSDHIQLSLAQKLLQIGKPFDHNSLFYEIKQVVSVFTIKEMVNDNGFLRISKLIDKDDFFRSELSIESLKAEVASDKTYSGTIVAYDQSSWGLYLLLNQGKVSYLTSKLDALKKIYSPLAILEYDGSTIISRRLSETIMNDILLFIPLTIVLFLITIWLNFRSFKSILIISLSLLVSTLCTMALMGYLKIEIQIVNTALPPLLVAIGSSYSIHILNQYYSEAHHYLFNKHQGIIQSTRHILRTILLAGITTLVGFLSLAISDISQVREFAFLSAFGILLSILISFTFIPALLSLIKPPEEVFLKAYQNDFLLKVLGQFHYLITRYSTLILWTAVTLVLLSVLGMFLLLRIESSPIKYFKEGSEIRNIAISIGNRFSGAYQLNVSFDTGKPEGVKEPAFLKKLVEIQKKIQHIEFVGQSFSIADFIGKINGILSEEHIEQIPDQKQRIIDYFDVISLPDNDPKDGLPDILENVVNSDFRLANLVIRAKSKETGSLGSQDIEILIKEIDKILSTYSDLPPYDITGGMVNFLRLSSFVLNGQVISLFLSLIVVFIISSFFFRSLKIALFSLIPLSFAVIFNFGIMSFIGIPLNPSTALISAITIGIGIDDTIHFLLRFQQYFRESENKLEAIHKTLISSGKAIIYTSITIIGGFIVLFFSSFSPISHFGVLTTLTMINTTLGAILILPSALLAVKSLNKLPESL